VDKTGGFLGDPVNGTPISVFYEPTWPEQVPELRIGETLTSPKFGLPDVKGLTSLQIIYEGSLTGSPLPSGELDSEKGPKSVLLHDSTRSKVFELSKGGLSAIPSSAATHDSRGKTFFQNLPTHLQERLFFDRNIGPMGALVFVGELLEEPVGEDYLLLNVFSEEDLEVARGLVDDGDELKGEWDEAMQMLSTTLERFIENPDVKGTFIRDPANVHEDFNATELVELNNPPARPQLPEEGDLGFFDEPVVSYALTAAGGGEGYVVLLAGNGVAFTPEEEPVSMHVFRVGGGLYRGELKPLVAANPLSENVTVQHTGDFAAKVADFEFEWRKAPPVDGLSPAVHEFTHNEIPGDGLSYELERADGETQEVELPIEVSIDDGEAPPGVSLITEMDLSETIPAGAELSRVYLGLTLDDTDAVLVFVNGVQVLDSLIDIAASSLPDDIDAIMSGGSSPDLVYAIDSRYFKQTSPNSLRFQYDTIADPEATSILDIQIAVTLQEDRSEENYLFLALENGKNRHLVAGSGIDTLSDNYYIMRYRPGVDNPLYPDGGYSQDNPGWSEWTRPALVEGWIKRVLAGINPFNQRVSDFFDNAVDTNVSLITQAGERWEGDIALNLDNVQDAGLIEIYEVLLGF